MGGNAARPGERDGVLAADTLDQLKDKHEDIDKDKDTTKDKEEDNEGDGGQPNPCKCTIRVVTL